MRDQFVVDVYQAGAGTSHNMNVNEVLANRAAELLGGARGDYLLVHPNDHVNMGQSTNDVFPAATRLALLMVHAPLVESARALAASFAAKAEAFDSVLKVGRTHLQDAVPMTLGQEFGGYAACIARGADDVEHAARALHELNLGATAVGTGLNAGEEYASLAIQQSEPLHRPAAQAGGQSLSRHAEHGRRRSPIRARCGDSRSNSERSRATCGSSAWDPVPVSARSACRPCSRARRSCPARSIRRCRKWSTRSASR